MGVGDGRAFLRAALARAFGEEGANYDDEDEVTGEMRLNVPLPRASGVVDRFARLRGEDHGADEGVLEEALQSGTVLAAGAAGIRRRRGRRGLTRYVRALARLRQNASSAP